MNTRQQVINKMNQGQESDTKIYTWNNTPLSLRIFWVKHFREQKKLKY